MSVFGKLFRRHPPAWAEQLGRNDPCWCGSDKEYFSRSLKTACNGPV
jgi:uncharacterized protein YecA (UPF0149 family)